MIYGELETINPKHLLFGNVISLEFRREDLTISNNMQESTKNVKILNALSTEHSLLFCSCLNLTNISKGRGLWKFNNSLISNTNFVDEMKTFI